jgi:hypothetical protein
MLSSALPLKVQHPRSRTVSGQIFQTTHSDARCGVGRDGPFPLAGWKCLPSSAEDWFQSRRFRRSFTLAVLRAWLSRTTDNNDFKERDALSIRRGFGECKRPVGKPAYAGWRSELPTCRAPPRPIGLASVKRRTIKAASGSRELIRSQQKVSDPWLKLALRKTQQKLSLPNCCHELS